MGKVFTWDAIQDGRIPKKESFQFIADALRETLSGEPSIVSALLFGSVVRGDFNIRSDIDCAVIYQVEEEEWAMSAMHEVSQLALTFHVPINFTPCDTVVAGTPFHHLHRSFVQHLQTSIDAGGLIKGNFVDLLAPTIPAEQEIESYIKMKMYSMQESLAQMTTFSEERFAAFLKKALEAPTHVARKMLIYEGTLQGDSKREVRERYRETMPRPLSDQFDLLLKADRLYSDDLACQMEELNKEQYEVTLDLLRIQLPKVLKFLRANIIRINSAC